MTDSQALPGGDQYPKSDYKEYPKTLRRDDLWGQVRRTVNGRPISEDEVRAIVAAVTANLDLLAEDTVLDLACGNGALSSRLLTTCDRLVGVDFSAYLIEIARENFESVPRCTFVEGDIVDYVRHAPDPECFTKAMCYAGIQYLDPGSVGDLFGGLRRRFGSIERLLVGNVPDRERAPEFFDTLGVPVPDLDDPVSQIGKWWTRDAVAAAAGDAGWEARFSRMPENVFNAAYRFDAVLVPKHGRTDSSR